MDRGGRVARDDRLGPSAAYQPGREKSAGEGVTRTGGVRDALQARRGQRVAVEAPAEQARRARAVLHDDQLGELPVPAGGLQQARLSGIAQKDVGNDAGEGRPEGGNTGIGDGAHRAGVHADGTAGAADLADHPPRHRRQRVLQQRVARHVQDAQIRQPRRLIAVE